MYLIFIRPEESLDQITDDTVAILRCTDAGLRAYNSIKTSNRYQDFIFCDYMELVRGMCDFIPGLSQEHFHEVYEFKDSEVRKKFLKWIDPSQSNMGLMQSFESRSMTNVIAERQIVARIVLRKLDIGSLNARLTVNVVDQCVRTSSWNKYKEAEFQ